MYLSTSVVSLADGNCHCFKTAEETDDFSLFMFVCVFALQRIELERLVRGRTVDGDECLLRILVSEM